MIIKHLEEYITRVREINANIDATPRGWLYFNGERLYFNPKEDDQIDDDKEVYMVDIRSSLKHEQLIDITSQDVGVDEGSVLESSHYLVN